MRALTKRITGFLKAEDGPTTVEYATLLALILVGVIGVMATFGESVNAMYQVIATAAGEA